MNFVAPGNAPKTTPLLQVTGDANIDNSRYRVALTGDYSLVEGYRLRLIQANKVSANNVSPITDSNPIKIGSTLVLADDVTSRVTQEVGDDYFDVIIAPGTQAQTVDGAEALPEGNLAGLALNLLGADLVASRGIGAAVLATKESEEPTFTPFATVSGGALRYNTGSHIDMHSLNLLAGFAAGVNTTPGRVVGGAFFEYGTASYKTYNDYGSMSFSGDGGAYYMGGGLLGRMDFADLGPGHFYVEGSGRMGGLYNSYENEDLRDAWGRSASYDTWAPYYSLHGGIGYVWNVSEQANLDLHFKYFWAHVGEDEVDLSTGESLDLEAMNSNRMRFGANLDFVYNEYVSPFLGVALEHEFDGDARSSSNGSRIATPTLRGTTYIGEVGVRITPSETLPLTLDFAVQGHAGVREGITGSALITYSF